MPRKELQTYPGRQGPNGWLQQQDEKAYELMPGVVSQDTEGGKQQDTGYKTGRVEHADQGR